MQNHSQNITCRIGLLVALSSIAALVPSGTAAVGAGKPNIVLMMADDLGWADPHFMGNGEIETPALDAMAKSGLVFQRFYAAAPVCSPTRGSCLTGRHPFRYGVFYANSGHLPQAELTLAELLKQRGYTAGHFGKWHLGTLTKTQKDSNRGGPRGAEHFSPPWAHGFDVSFSTEAKVPTWDPMLRPAAAGRNTWWDPVTNASQAQPYGTAYWNHHGEQITDNLRGDDSRVIMDRVIPFVRNAVRRERPFFAVIWFHTPHLPVAAGPELTKLYSRFSKYKQHYYGSITAMDRQIDRLRRELRELGAAQRTMLWFCSDNGPEGAAGRAPGSAGPLRGRKRSLFEGGIRVPGVLEWPARVKPGLATKTPASTSDYLPTILESLGIDMPDQRPIDGVSLLPLLGDQAAKRPRPLAFESRGQLALIENRYKIVSSRPDRRGKRGKSKDRGADPQLKFLLFDLAADPGEENDVASEHPEIVEKLSASLLSWQDSCRRSLGGADYRREK